MAIDWSRCQACFGNVIETVRARELAASIILGQKIKKLETVGWSSLVTGMTTEIPSNQHADSDDTLVEEDAGKLGDKDEDDDSSDEDEDCRAGTADNDMTTTIWILRSNGRIRSRIVCPAWKSVIVGQSWPVSQDKRTNNGSGEWHALDQNIRSAQQHHIDPMASESKTAEFARLFDLFERLASRKSRTRNDENHDDVVRSMPLPADLAPVVTSLAGLVGTRKHQEDAHDKKSNKRARRNTVATSSRNGHDSDDSDDMETLAKFPLGKRYPFTFKLMLHKLYQLDDWAQKVKEVLERSQIEYKPLAERDAEEEKKVEEEEQQQDGRVHFKAGTAGGGSRRPAVRPRSHSVMALNNGKGREAVLLSPSPKSSRQWGPAGEDVRAVKKRCVGRRKSLSGPLGEVGRIGGSWVYDAAVSSVEFTGRELQADQLKAGGDEMSKHPSLGAGPAKVAGRRRISLGATSATAQQQHLASGMARRRALSVMNNLTTAQAQRKRPFES
ncbi:hypothetical protein DXG03_009515 [Asterophora parasitica]|uniref:Uncharacterized protein n=1 Tax=Asterophora parasitica TaxID=117018 RepID=A0A9P7GAU3_9AGAR|nr:hypothetical protein DXG03_009515 [Asterophora parasitica]